MNLGRRANLNINSRQNCSRFSLKYSLDFSFCSPSAIVLPALHNFFRVQWNITKLSSSIYEFHLFTRKTRRETLPCGLFSLNVCEATRKARALQVASYNRLQRREFWAETHTPLWLLIRRIIFVTHKRTSFTGLIERITFFTSERYRCSLLWLARNHLRMNFSVSKSVGI